MAEILICAADFKGSTIETVRSAFPGEQRADRDRATILAARVLGDNGVTYIPDGKGGFKKGAAVVPTPDMDFITTKPNSSKADTLDNLPPLAKAPFPVGSYGR